MGQPVQIRNRDLGNVRQDKVGLPSQEPYLYFFNLPYSPVASKPLAVGL
jgi:hypothetical protein